MVPRCRCNIFGIGLKNRPATARTNIKIEKVELRVKYSRVCVRTITFLWQIGLLMINLVDGAEMDEHC